MRPSAWEEGTPSAGCLSRGACGRCWEVRAQEEQGLLPCCVETPPWLCRNPGSPSSSAFLLHQESPFVLSCGCAVLSSRPLPSALTPRLLLVQALSPSSLALLGRVGRPLASQVITGSTRAADSWRLRKLTLGSFPELPFANPRSQSCPHFKMNRWIVYLWWARGKRLVSL